MSDIPKDELAEYIDNVIKHCNSYGLLPQVLYLALNYLTKGDDEKIKQALSDAMYEWDI